MSALILVANAVRVRHNVMHWWGSCSYRKLHVTYEVKAMLCPFCKSEMHDGAYSGHQIIITARRAFGYIRDCWMPLFEDGVRVWHVLPEHRGRKPYFFTERVEKSYD
jgi:hypothetical protein